jgi:uncharacterized Zn-binding protein involved in type VI secretion
MPAAARITDDHTCPKVEPGPVPHVGGPVVAGDATVLIGFQPAARVGDALACSGPADAVSQGDATVLIGFKHAARLGDPTTHGGVLVAGCPSVIIGSSTQSEALKTDQPFCAECERKRLEAEAQARRAARSGGA